MSKAAVLIRAQVGELKALREEVRALTAEVERLQTALSFWLPGVPLGDDEIAERAGNDSFLLGGFDGPNLPSAYELGWAHLRSAGIVTMEDQWETPTLG